MSSYDKPENVVDAREKFNAVSELNKIRKVRESLEAVALQAVRRAREDEVSWDEIGDALGIGSGPAYVLYAHLLRESCGKCWKCLSVAGPVNWNDLVCNLRQQAVSSCSRP